VSIPTNYSTLKTEVANVLARTDLSTDVPTFIKYGEVDMNNRLRIREMIASANINPSASVKYVSLPTGFLELISFNDVNGEPLKEVGLENLANLANGTGSGVAEFFSISSRIDFERTGSASDNFPMRYFKRSDVANDDAISAAIIPNYPNIYVYSALVHAEPFLGNDARMPTWKVMYNAAVKEANERSAKNNRQLRTDIINRRAFNIVSGN
jgi:hypothetical protein